MSPHVNLADDNIITDGQYPVCPTCSTNLTNPDDAVLSNLKPTDDYKARVLSSLNPGIITEFAGRALSFWAYQATQEIVYQEFCARKLTNKHALLNCQMDKIIGDANIEISNMRNKMLNMQNEHNALRLRNEELARPEQERTHKHQHTQKIYDKMKRRDMLGQVQNAASDAVDQDIQASVAAKRYADKVGNQNRHIPPPPPFPLQQPNTKYSGRISVEVKNMGPPITNAHRTWAGFGGQGGKNYNQMQKSSSHHTRPPTTSVQPLAGRITCDENGDARTPIQRPPLGNLSSNSYGFAGYRMSAGLKASNSVGAEPNGLHIRGISSRVAQRPISSQSLSGATTFGDQDGPNMFASSNDFY